MAASLKLAGVVRESIVDGPGYRFVIFTQGCPHRCEGCHNPDTHDVNGGYMSDPANLIREIKKNPLLKGITLSGGEPFTQAAPLAALAKEVRSLGLNILTYSGWTIEELLQMAADDPGVAALLRETDVLIDGRFEVGQKTMLLKFKGSSNQRFIDSKASLEAGKAVEIEDLDKFLAHVG